MMGTGERPPAARPGRSPLARDRGARGRAPSDRPARRLESRARARALQALYAWDVRSSATEGQSARRTPAPRTDRLPLIADAVWDDLAVAPDERRAAARLIREVADRLPEVDQALTHAATNWRLARMGVIDRSVLRLATAELASGSTPARVVITEAVHLAERYGTTQSAQFVNGVLDAVARQMDRL
jgi:transcription antitermination protein NusB